MRTPAPLRVTEASARVYRKVWRGSVISTFLNPILYLTAIGLGLGSQVEAAAFGDVSYLTFLATGVLAATAMQTGSGEGSYPVMAGLKWVKDLHAVTTTPIGVADLVVGMAIWLVMRIAFSVLVFALIATLFGAFSLTTALAAIGPAVLTGIAFAAPVSAWTASIENDVHLSTFFRFAIMPLFLFSGTFFPITNLPSWLQPVAFVSPLWHGVELTRGVAGLPDSPRWPWQIHTGILVALTAVGLVLAVRKFSKRLRV